ncbi:zinc finger protein 121-like [Euwallacea similis]|uniref:zinc finger protein 121-like n=1 Tax=Euwallacea similis TaxID=1736056 RepID=UPI00344CF787
MECYRCRLCLENLDTYVHIFKQDKFAEMIEQLSGIKVDIKDGLPDISCHRCHQLVKTAILTRYQIINSYKILIKELTLKNLSANIDKEPENNDKSLENIKIENEIFQKEDASANFASDSNSSELITSLEPIENNSRATRKKTLRNVTSKQIKFKRKQSGKQVKFKKKDSASVKVQYNIKPEHQEFLKTVGRKDRVACPDCGRVMFGMNMKNHLITHQYDPVNCKICGKTSKNAQALQDHINYYHKTTPDRFMCDKCGKGYRVRFMLLKHVKKEHGNGEKDYECSVCGKKFYEKLHLKNHINITHNKVKAYKCEHCGKDFGRRTQFVTHQLVHTKESRYHCQICEKGFKIKQTMQTHLKGVHGIEEEKTIFCKICHKGFSTSQGLRAHVNSRVHGLEKCEHCSEFITVEYKQVHLKDVHGIILEAAYG